MIYGSTGSGGNLGSYTASAAVTFDATTDLLIWNFQLEEADTLTHIGVIFAGKTGNSCRHKVTIYDWDTTVGPYSQSTVLGYGYCNPQTDGWTAMSYHEIALVSGVTLTKGAYISVELKPDLDTAEVINGSNLSKWMVAGGEEIGQVSPYGIAYAKYKNITGSIVAEYYATFNVPNAMLLRGSSGRYYGGIALLSVESTSGTATSYGNRFYVPSELAKQFVVSGVNIYCRMANTSAAKSASFDIELYTGGDVSNTTLTTSDTRTGYHMKYTADYRMNNHLVLFSNPVTCSANTWYRVAMRRTSSDSPSPFKMNFAPEQFNVFPFGNNMYASIRTSGDWTDTSNMVVSVFPFISEIIPGSGGGLSNKFNLGFN